MVGTSQALDGPLAPYAAGFREQLVLLGYSARAISQHLELLRDMSTWLMDESLAPAELTGNETTRFLGVRRARGRQSLEIYSRIALADAQHSYDQVIGRFPV